MKLSRFEKYTILAACLITAILAGFMVGRSAGAADYYVEVQRSAGEEELLSGRISAQKQAYAAKGKESSEDGDSAQISGEAYEVCVNINTADEQALCELPGIGETLAKRIIAYREECGAFESTEEIMEVSGIGEGIFSDIEPYITY